MRSYALLMLLLPLLAFAQGVTPEEMSQAEGRFVDSFKKLQDVRAKALQGRHPTCGSAVRVANSALRHANDLLSRVEREPRLSKVRYSFILNATDRVEEATKTATSFYNTCKASA